MNKKGKLFRKWIIITVVCAVAAFLIPMMTTVFLADDNGPVVIVLDPGHGGADVGAINHRDGFYESDANLAIALACRDELLKYDNIEVYMTHEGIDPGTTMSLGERIDCVQTYGADILISLHCNDATNKEAHGAEVFVSHSEYKSSYNSESTALAVEFLKKFNDRGLTIRGVKTRLSGGNRLYYHDDGTIEIGDYYAVIGGTIKKYGVPGILVEHAFITGDYYEFLDTRDKLEQLGVADAMAIVEYYGLSLKGEGGTVDRGEEAVLVTDADIASASDVNAALVGLPDTADPEAYDDLQQVRGGYERLSPAGRTLVEKDYLDKLYRLILELDNQVYPVRLAALEESELSINRVSKTVSGLDLATDELAGTNASSLVSSLFVYVDMNFAQPEQADLSDVQILVLGRDGEQMDIGAQLGTGCTVVLMRGEEIIDSLSVVIICDLSGDGHADSRDHLLLENYLDGIDTLDEAAIHAADVNLDGVVDRNDLNELLYRVVDTVETAE